MGLIHGDFKLSFIDNILIVKLTGSFNEFGAMDLTVAIKEKITSFQGQPFCMLVDDIEFEGFTPEAYRVVEENNKWLNEQSLIAKAFLMRSIVQEELDDYFVPSKQKQNVKAFCKFETAIEWLKSQYIP